LITTFTVAFQALNATPHCRIKALTSILKVDLSSNMVKKIILRPAESNSGSYDDFLHLTMCQPELKELFESKINYEQVGAPTVPSAVILVPSEFVDSSCQTGVTESQSVTVCHI
jgi:hypothetical protein